MTVLESLRVRWRAWRAARAAARRELAARVATLEAELERARHPDPEAFFASLIPSKIGRDYTRTDRYRDFRHVFLDSRDGRRVLWQIFAWCHMFRPAAVAGDTHETYRREGERNVGLRIMATLNAEPAAEPEATENEKGDAGGATAE